MKLDKLKELKAKTTKGKWNYIHGDIREEEDGVNLGISGIPHSVDMTQDDKDFTLELQNQSDEMIETIERYESALEKSKEYQRLAYNQLYKLAQDQDNDTDEESKNRMLHNARKARGNMVLGIDTCMEALKDPEKTKEEKNA